MIDKDIKKMLKTLESQGFAVNYGNRRVTLIAPNGARTHLPTGNNNRMGVTFVRKFAKNNGGSV